MRNQRSEFPHSTSLVAGLPRSWLQVTLFVLVGLILSWLILTHSLVVYLATIAPQKALFLSSKEPAAVLALADRELNFSAKGDPQPEGRGLRLMRHQVEMALAADPLNARAYRLLGQLAELENAGSKAARFMRATARHSLNETFAVEWMMRKSFENRDYAATAFYADALLRTHPNLMGYAIPILARMAENADVKKEVEKLLSANPPWRSWFFPALMTAITDARTPFGLFLSLKDSGAPPTAAELQSYISFLFQHQLYEFAYNAWLQFLPPEQAEIAGFLFNGSFELKPSSLPFDWQMPQGDGVIAEIAPRPGASDQRALFLEFGQGRVVFPGVYETVVLPPGAYRFKASFQGAVFGPRGLQWGISCLQGAAIGESQMILGSFAAWRDLEFAFVVPETGCRAQLVRLDLAARSASEQLVSGAIWFDELSILRQPEGLKD